jgi:hypothetical protein
MDLDALKYLSDEDKNTYMILERLFSQPGWKLVVALAEKLSLEARDRAAFAKSWDDNRIAIGQGYAYNHIASFEDSTQAEFEQKAGAAKEKAADKDEDDFE